MSRRVLFVAVLLAFAVGAAAQTYAPPRYLVSEELFEAIATEYSGAKAKENVAGIVQFHRIQASPGFSEARRWVVERLRALGVTDVEVETFLSDGKRRYQTFTSPMAWTVREGELWVEAPFSERFCRYSDVPMCLTTLSKGGEWSGELVHVGRGAEPEDYEGVDVRGKVVLASSYAALVHREAVIKRGALGVLIYPPADDPSTSLGAGRPEHPRMVRYNGLWLQAEEVERAGFGFQLSRQQAERLLVALEAGETVRVRASVDAEVHPGQLEVVSAFFRPSAELRASGTRQPEKEIILVAHLDHPKWSANDNASGSGALIEIARVLKTLREEGGVKLQRTIRLMWVPEYMGTMAWIDRHQDIGERAIAALNLDMVGENLHATNSVLRITRTPDSMPSFLNDLVENVAAQVAAAELTDPQGSKNLFHYKMTPHDMGSDHDIFNDSTVGVPAMMFGHWPDWTHHTSEDTIDKIDPTTLKRVGVLATASAVWLATAESEEWSALAELFAINQFSKLNMLLGQEFEDEDSGWWSYGAASMRAALRLRALDTGLHAMQAVTRPAVPSRVEQLLNTAHEFGREFGIDDNTYPPGHKQSPIPRRSFLGPLEDSYASPWFREQMGERYAWWQEQARAVPNWGLLVYETLNFTDGERSLAEIEDAVRAEFGEVGEGVVERILRDLESIGLVEFTPKQAE